MAFSRRAVLLQGTAILASVPFLGPMALAGTDSNGAVGFVGDNIVQLTVIDTLFDTSPTVSVSQKDDRRWSPDPFDSFGAMGRFNGVEGYFSGDTNPSQPQRFTAWPRIVPDSQWTGFNASNGFFQRGAPVDQPGEWRVTIDGDPAGVVSVYRKTVPIRTLAVAKREWQSTKRHNLTLVLDRAIPDGAQVLLEGPSIPAVKQSRSPKLFNEALHVCHAGYPLSGPKKAYVGAWWGHDADGRSGSSDALLSPETTWTVISTADGAKVQSGSLMLAKPASDPHRKGQNFNGCDIYEADFSGIDTEGEYILQVDGFGQSFPFRISAAPYAEALRLAARWYFHQRSGCEITEPYGEGRTRPRNGHPEDGLTVWQTDVRLGDTGEGYGKTSATQLLSEQPVGVTGLDGVPVSARAQANPDAWGGWHDAGDWDRRIQHMDVVFHMADIVELFDHTRSLHLNLPESGKPFAHPDVLARKNAADRGDGMTVLPDLIHEALWGISLWRRTQGADGAVIGGVEYSNPGIFGSVSWNPVQIAYAYGPEDWAAYNFALSAAKLGHVIKHTCGDPILGDALMEEAAQAWRWAEQDFLSEKRGARDPEAEEVTAQARVAAAAVLYRASGDTAARDVFEGHNPFVPRSDTPAQGIKKGHYPHAYAEYVLAARDGRLTDPEIVAAIEGWIGYRAKRSDRMGADYGLHSTDTYPWGRGWLRFGPGSNWRAGEFALYHAVNGELPPQMADAVAEGMWFGLGCNPSNTSFVQGLGHRDFSDPLMLDPNEDPPIPGQISFGVAGGKLHQWEQRKTAGAIFPAEQDHWPIYAQIFESRSIAICAEHGIKSNALEWLVACALVNQHGPEPSQ
ncbi:glycoside hydrolase family 9 protein [Ruegeria arenilitoris]|uniref:glycoside hydrolase family 9 protein n=1 Tax=Ruegeria arenilitoris TaxID=1173585 RepID=UPI00147E3985|nr:glycoside hydrolase family 9 protein [Ruegeria arenilitoris]